MPAPNRSANRALGLPVLWGPVFSEGFWTLGCGLEAPTCLRKAGRERAQQMSGPLPQFPATTTPLNLTVLKGVYLGNFPPTSAGNNAHPPPRLVGSPPSAQQCAL